MTTKWRKILGKTLKWIALGVVLTTILLILTIAATTFKVISAFKEKRPLVDQAQPTITQRQWIPQIRRKDFNKENVSRNNSESRTSDKLDSSQIKEERFSGLPQLTYLISQPIGSIDLCHIGCKDLPDAMNRIRDYGKGRYQIAATLEDDPAFQLAKLVHQAAFGPAGKEFFELIGQIQKDPYSLKSLGVVSFLWRIDAIKSEFEKRGKSRALEADALIDTLKNIAAQCDDRTWNQDCRHLESEIGAWINEGALH